MYTLGCRRKYQNNCLSLFQFHNELSAKKFITNTATISNHKSYKNSKIFTNKAHFQEDIPRSHKFTPAYRVGKSSVVWALPLWTVGSQYRFLLPGQIHSLLPWFQTMKPWFLRDPIKHCPADSIGSLQSGGDWPKSRRCNVTVLSFSRHGGFHQSQPDSRWSPPALGKLCCSDIKSLLLSKWKHNRDLDICSDLVACCCSPGSESGLYRNLPKSGTSPLHFDRDYVPSLGFCGPGSKGPVTVVIDPCYSWGFNHFCCPTMQTALDLLYRPTRFMCCDHAAPKPAFCYRKCEDFHSKTPKYNIRGKYMRLANWPAHQRIYKSLALSSPLNFACIQRLLGKFLSPYRVFS